MDARPAVTSPGPNHARAAKPTTVPKTKLRPPVPKRDEQPVCGLQSNKDFITSNAVENILAKPKKVPQAGFQWTSRPGGAGSLDYWDRGGLACTSPLPSRVHAAQCGVLCSAGSAAAMWAEPATSPRTKV